MAKSLEANKKLMQNYLSELLTEEVEEVASSLPTTVIEKKTNDKNLEKLLENVSTKEPVIVSRKSQYKAETKVVERETVEQVPVAHKKPAVKEEIPIETRKSQGDIALKVEHNYRQGSFQAMFFDVAGLTIAVPLIELGGIHNVEKTNSLMGKPDWFKGVMIHREEQINVVDTAMWVMPEKCDEALINSLEYQYIIMLSDSSWGLMAEHLVDTVTLQQEDVKWLDSPSKRPWLAGLVKDRMCALLEVESLIKLLNDGANIHQK
ncbi:chemotaxis protein CheW [Colwelliaceae bacterium 6471]